MRPRWHAGYSIILLIAVTSVKAMEGLRCHCEHKSREFAYSETKKHCKTEMKYCYGKAMYFCKASSKEVNDVFIQDCDGTAIGLNPCKAYWC
ncbi:MAG: hypothetical protein BYD32DRAFT_409477 [Podila humilis]|nr:MAG: hypothetical protein BYD32DRAFT_409477 [Podila humilis]